MDDAWKFFEASKRYYYEVPSLWFARVIRKCSSQSGCVTPIILALATGGQTCGPLQVSKLNSENRRYAQCTTRLVRPALLAFALVNDRDARALAVRIRGELPDRDPLGGWGAVTRRGRIARTSQPTLHHKKGMHKLQHWSCGSDAPTEAGGVGDAAARRGSATDAFVPSAPTAVCAHVSFSTRPPGVPPTAMARCATTVEVFTPHHQRTSRRRASARRKRRPTTGLPARAGFSCLSDARANALQFWGALVRPGARRGM